MSKQILVNSSHYETRVAVLENGEIRQLHIEREEDKNVVGNVYLGVVKRVLPGMQAAFLELGLERTAFLYVDDIIDEPFGSDVDYLDEEDASDEPLDDNASADLNEEETLDEVHRDHREPDEVINEDGSKTTSAENLSAEEQEPNEPETPLTFEDDAGPAPILVAPEMAADPEGDDDDEEEDFDDDEDDDGFENERAEPPLEFSEVEETPEETAPPQAPETSPITTAPKAPTADFRRPSDSRPRESEYSERHDSERQSPERQDFENRDRDQPENDRQPQFRENRPDDYRETSGEDENFGNRAPSDQRDPRDNRDSRDPRDNQRPNDRPQGRYADSGRRPNQGGGGGRGGEGRYSRGGGRGGGRYRPRGGRGDNRGRGPGQGQGQGQGASRQGGEARGGGGDERRFEGRQGRASGRPRGRSNQRYGRGGGNRGRYGRRRPRGTAQIQDLLKEGQEILVQVAKAPIGTKGARLTTHISLPGRNLVLMPTVKHLGISRRIEGERERRRLRDIFTKKLGIRDVGFIIRTVAEGKSFRDLKADADYLIKTWIQIKRDAKAKRAPALIYEDLSLPMRSVRDFFTEDVDSFIIDNPQEHEGIARFITQFVPRLKSRVKLFKGPSQLFEHYGIEAEISRALNKKVWLKSGGYLLIDQSEALTAIDVNTGRYVGSKSLEETIFRTNLEAVKEIAYQLRVRNVGGIIIIDLIDMESHDNREKVYNALHEALSEDKSKTNILKISELGLVEMTRKRTHEDLIRYLTEACPHCDGRGYTKSRRTVCFEIFREVEKESLSNTKNIVVFASPGVVSMLQKEEGKHVGLLQKRLEKNILIKPDPAFHTEQFEVFGKH